MKLLTKKERQRSAKRELRRLEKMALHPRWTIGGVVSSVSGNYDTIECDDIDDAPESESEFLRQMADFIMRPLVEKAIEAYKAALEKEIDS